MVHDVDHTGVSNKERAQEEPDKAAKYKNKSIAEQNSVDLAWNILMGPEFQNLQRAMFATDSEVRRFRQLLVNLVMATDIFETDAKAARNMRWEKVFHSDLKDTLEETEFRNLKATIVIEHIIQAADVSHTMQHWQVYTRWNERLFQEMYRAYEDGRSTNDPSKGWYNGELWFFDNYVIPLARKLEECGVFGVTSDECLNYALENRKEWEMKGKEIVEEMTERFQLSRRPSLWTPFGAERTSTRNFNYYASRDSQIVTTPPLSPSVGKGKVILTGMKEAFIGNGPLQKHDDFVDIEAALPQERHPDYGEIEIPLNDIEYTDLSPDIDSTQNTAVKLTGSVAEEIASWEDIYDSDDDNEDGVYRA